MPRMFCIAALMLAALTHGRATEEKPTEIPQPFGPAGREAQSVQPPPASIFQPVTVDPTLVRKSMQARAEYDRMNREITARKTRLFEGNPTLQELQKQMRELQEKIDAIVEEDAELKKLHGKLQEISPELPSGARPFPMAPKPPVEVKQPPEMPAAE